VPAAQLTAVRSGGKISSAYLRIRHSLMLGQARRPVEAIFVSIARSYRGWLANLVSWCAGRWLGGCGVSEGELLIGDGVTQGTARMLTSPFLQQAEVAQALGGFNNRGLGWAWAPSELLLGAVVVDDQSGRLRSCCLFGWYSLG
jgi:hypothetical protein